MKAIKLGINYWHVIISFCRRHSRAKLTVWLPLTWRSSRYNLDCTEHTSPSDLAIVVALDSHCGKWSLLVASDLNRNRFQSVPFRKVRVQRKYAKRRWLAKSVATSTSATALWCISIWLCIAPVESLSEWREVVARAAALALSINPSCVSVSNSPVFRLRSILRPLLRIWPPSQSAACLILSHARRVEAVQSAACAVLDIWNVT